MIGIKISAALMKTVWVFFKKLIPELSGDQTVPLIGGYQNEINQQDEETATCVCSLW